MVRLDKAAKNILKNIPARGREVLARRFGVGNYKNKETLEAIGQDHEITRERVRQIEAAALVRLRHNCQKEIAGISLYLNEELNKKGGLAGEDEFLKAVALDCGAPNSVSFFLSLDDKFARLSENDEFFPRWTNNPRMADKIETALAALRKELSLNDLLSEKEMLAKFSGHLNLNEISEKTFSSGFSLELLLSFLAVSKKIKRNHLGEWGLADSSQISPRGMKDMAHMVLRKNNEPMHFKNIAVGIESLLKRPAHIQTVHNELIKDGRFVLVGRGLYALNSMGYKSGIVADVIKQILKERSPLAKEEIIKEVLKQRRVKEGTIAINLQNKEFFKKTAQGHYLLA